MGTSLELRGALAKRAVDVDPLDAVESIARARATAFPPDGLRDRDERGRPLLALAIHPAAEPVRVVLAGEGTLELEALTGTAGPGYHAHVCALADDLARALDLTWQEVRDETGYFEARERAPLEDATRIWLATTAHEALALHARGTRNLQLSLPEGTLFEHGGAIATPMGPRDHAWLARVAKEPAHGLDALPWWDEGETPEVLRDAAIAAMWIDVRWRAPILDAERALFERVLGWLERGQALAPDLEWPWREQSELFELLGDASLRATRAHLRATALPPAPAIGYRRSPVRAHLTGGWSLRIPGEFAEKWEDRGTWVGFDGTRALWFSSIEVRGSASSEATIEALPPLEGEGELLGTERGDLLAMARFAEGEEEGKRLIQLRAQAALGEHAAIGTFVLARDEDRDWSLETWATLAHVEERPRSD